MRPVGAVLVRLVVPSPDRRRVLARPTGLSGWTLPVVALDEDPADVAAWPEGSVAAASRAVGALVRPVRPVAAAGWEVEALERIPATGVTWIGPEEAGRLGADAGVLLGWAALDEG